MKVKFAVAAVAACLVVTACGVGPNMQGFSLRGSDVSNTNAQDPANRFKVLTEIPECPTCCVAITGTSHFDFTVNNETFTMNFEINTASGRINSVQIGPVGEDPTKYDIVSAECILDTEGNLTGATVTVDGAVFTLAGTPQGGHAQAQTIAGVITGTGFPFDDFGATSISTGQNLFVDNGCDGTPN